MKSPTLECGSECLVYVDKSAVLMDLVSFSSPAVVGLTSSSRATERNMVTVNKKEGKYIVEVVYSDEKRNELEYVLEGLDA